MLVLLNILFDLVFDLKVLSFSIICTLLWYLHYKQNRRIIKFAKSLDGPKGLPFVGNAFMFLGDSQHFFKQFLKLFTNWKSPTRVWLGNRLYIAVKKPEDVEVVLTTCLNKDPEMYRHTVTLFGTGLFSNLSVSDWKRHRKIIMPTFNQKTLNEFHKIFNAQSTTLATCLEKELNQGPFDISSYLNFCTMNNICETAMGLKNNQSNSKENQLLFTESFSRVVEIISLKMFNIFYGIDFFYRFTSTAKEERSKIEFMRNFTQKIINQKRESLNDSKINNEEKTKKVFLDYLIENGCFNDTELTDEVLTMILAGNHTIAATLSYMCMLLGMHQDVQDKVYEEINEYFADDSRNVEVEDLRHLTYLEMVIKETLRIFPVGVVLVREVENDIKLGTLNVPKGCSCMVNVWATQHDPLVWPDPEKFDPERFRPEEVSNRHPYAWIPFGGGPRNCAGIKFAMMALKTFSVNIFRKYKVLEPAYKMEDLEFSLQIILRPIKGFMVSLALRE